MYHTKKIVYDNVGNPTDVLEDTGDTVAWDYDAAYQLKNATRVGTAAYNNTMTYDAAGNRETLKLVDGAVTTYSYNGANELETSEDSAGTTTYTYLCKGQAGSCFVERGYGFCLPFCLAG